jgi:hypothetical protein
VHLACAIVYGCAEFLTFDENDIRKPSRAKRGLIPLSGNVAGHRLTISKPVATAPRLRLVLPPPAVATDERSKAAGKGMGGESKR